MSDSDTITLSPSGSTYALKRAIRLLRRNNAAEQGNATPSAAMEIMLIQQRSGKAENPLFSTCATFIHANAAGAGISSLPSTYVDVNRMYVGIATAIPTNMPINCAMNCCFGDCLSNSPVLKSCSGACNATHSNTLAAPHLHHVPCLACPRTADGRSHEIRCHVARRH